MARAKTIIVGAGLAMALMACAPVAAETPAPTALPSPTPDAVIAATPDDLAGVWIGGFDVPGTARVPLLEISVTVAGGTLSGEAAQYLDAAKTRPAPVLAQVTEIGIDDQGVRLTLVNDGVEITLVGSLTAGSRLAGEARAGSQTGTFALARAAMLDGSSIAEQEGEYISGGSAFGLYPITAGFSDSAASGFWLVDLNSGQWRMAFPVSEDSAVIGAAFGIATPFDGALSFQRRGDGQIAGIRLDRGDSASLAARAAFKIEDVTFPSGDLTLAGRLTLPSGAGPHPAAVITHGSEPGSRGDYRLLASLLAHRGVAAFTYDKRGVGNSEGVYVEQASEENIRNLAGDAAAAVAYVKSRPEIDSTKIGMWGASQAGWVIPLAATQSPDVAFIILTSGPVVSVGEESQWSAYTNDGARPIDKTFEEMDAEIEAARPSGVDSQPAIRQLKVPGLWLFGEFDRSVPVQKSVRNLARIKEETGADLTWVVLPGGNHSLFQTADGMTASWPYSDGFAPGYLDALFDWLLPRVAAGQ